MLRLQHVALSTPSVLPLSSHYQHHISSGICDFPSSGFTVTGFIKCNEYSYAERSCKYLVRAYRYVSSDEEDEESGDGSVRFEEAVKLFNERKYYACHDLLESLWFDSYDPLRTLLHALLQCAVAFYHLFNQNHKGAMMEMGEGLCKLRKLNFKDGPFHEFEQQISSVLNFIYQTQLELAACNEDFCLTMEQTERSYQLLEGFGAGQQLYFLEEESSDGTQQHTYIVFDPQRCYGAINVPITRVQLPFLEATRTHLMACEN